MRLDAETEVAQDLGPQAIAQTDVLEPDHVPLRRAASPARANPTVPMRTLYSNGNGIGVGLPFGQFDGLAQPFSPRASWPTPLLPPPGPLGPAERRGRPWFPFR